MHKYMLKRLLLAIPTLIGVTVLIFVAMRILPGDPLRVIVGETSSGSLTDEQLAVFRASLGLDKPLHVQYLSWMGDVLKGEMGKSFWRDEPVRDLILRRAPISAEIAAIAIFIACLVGIPVGMLSAMKPNTAVDGVARFFSILFIAVPSFWLAMIIIMVMVLSFSWRPPLELVQIWDDPWTNLQIVIWPGIVLGLGVGAIMGRFTRSAMLEVLGEDYVRTARAKGLPGRTIIWPHTFKNAILPVITISGMAFGGLLGGSVAVETALAVPGLGAALVMAINGRDWMVVQNLVLIYGVLFTLSNLVVDLSYSWFDPRIRYE